VVSGIVCPYKFSNYDLARRARAHLFLLLEKFDLNKNLTFEEGEIINILKTLLKSDDLDIFYVVANVFRYDTDGDRRVTYDELVNFFLELHNGELAIQRLHKASSYVRGAQRQLNLAEFIKTLTYAFSFIEFTVTEAELTLLFSEVDLDHDGWITYQEYFEFLRFYFGSLSLVYKEKDNKPPVEPVDPYGKLSPEERFARITIDQLLLILKLYRFQPFSKVELARFLVEIFGLTDDEIEFAIIRFFRYDIFSGGYFLDTDVVRILLELYFAELILLRLHRAKKFARWSEFLLSLEDFLLIVELATGWLKVKHDKGLLGIIFKIIDTNGDGFISYKEFMAFIRKYLGGRICIEDFVDPLADTEPTEEEFYGHIWSELRQIYKHYVKGKFLTAEELRLLVNEVLKEYKKSDMEYIFLNMFRVDPNKDSNIEFEEFVSLCANLGTLHPQARRRDRAAQLPHRAGARQEDPRRGRVQARRPQRLRLPQVLRQEREAAPLSLRQARQGTWLRHLHRLRRMGVRLHRQQGPLKVTYQTIVLCSSYPCSFFLGENPQPFILGSNISTRSEMFVILRLVLQRSANIFR
jgi:Ca2+-binding EF-hand superfamily protein